MATTLQLQDRWYYCGAAANVGRVHIVDRDGATVLLLDGKYDKADAEAIAKRLVREHNYCRLHNFDPTEV